MPYITKSIYLFLLFDHQILLLSKYCSIKQISSTHCQQVTYVPPRLRWTISLYELYLSILSLDWGLLYEINKQNNINVLSTRWWSFLLMENVVDQLLPIYISSFFLLPFIHKGIDRDRTVMGVFFWLSLLKLIVIKNDCL